MIDKEVFYKESNYININLSALSHNYLFLKKRVQKNTKIIAMVKSNAYGHGLIPISKHLEFLDVDAFGVFTIDEAKLLRDADIKKDIIIFGPFLEHHIPEILSYDLSLVVGSYDEIKILQKYNGQKQIKLHIKIDTGMGRIGFLPEEGFQIIQDLYKNRRSLVLDGICTHFSDSSSISREYTEFQGNRFIELVDRLKSNQYHFPLIHAANSAAILRYPQFHFNAVRPGILLYGVDPFINEFNLKPILSLHSFVSSIKDVPENSFISYNRTFQTKTKTKIAIVPIGYADGYLLSLSNKSYVSINKHFYPIIGNICMNQFIVDISSSIDIHTNDTVTLIEAKNDSQLGLINLANLSKTIPYEILCRLSESIRRIYTQKDC
jgi:alanine racemase